MTQIHVTRPLLPTRSLLLEHYTAANVDVATEAPDEDDYYACYFYPAYYDGGSRRTFEKVRFEPRDKFSTLSTSTKGSTLASSTSTLSTLVESVSGISTSTAEGGNPLTSATNTEAIDGIGQQPLEHASTGGGQPNGKLQQLNFNFGTMAPPLPKDGGAGGHLSSSPSTSRLKHGGGLDGCTSAPPHSKSGRFQNEENDGNFSNQQQQHQQQQQQSYHHSHPLGHPTAHRTVSISTTAIVCGGGGRDGSRTPVPPGTGAGGGGGGSGGGPGSTDSARQRMRTSSMPVENRKVQPQVTAK